MIKKIFSAFFLLALTLVASGYTRPDVYKIDPTTNAINHNNIGLKDVCEHNYYDAIQEFSLAIALNPKTQATAVYYNNLGETYMRIADFRAAQGCFELAIKQYNLNLLYYQNLVSSFKAQKVMPAKIQLYKAKGEKDPMNMIILGLLYVSSGNIQGGIIKLDEFCMKEPDLLISDAVRSYIQSIVPNY